MGYDVYGSNYGKHDNLSFALIVVLFILLIIAGAALLSCIINNYILLVECLSIILQYSCYEQRVVSHPGDPFLLLTL
nr:YjcZ family sporulation protein [Lysinibacillus boronitolerans]